RAAALRRVLVSQDKTTTDPMAVVDWINMFALAVNEENAAGGRDNAFLELMKADGINPEELFAMDSAMPRSAKKRQPRPAKYRFTD
ncbi:hypothetical protein MJM99_30935, partial [Salmonella enterica subsp. enterica serovar Kentucky]|nr:hypothetical protein [Salmonella enterica subsp. enterica serovar Kentucky]